MVTPTPASGLPWSRKLAASEPLSRARPTANPGLNSTFHGTNGWISKSASFERQMHQQKIAVDHQQRGDDGNSTAQSNKRTRGRDDAHRPQHDRDLEQRLGKVEIWVALGGVIALGLQFLGLREQLLLTLAGRRVAFVALDPRLIALDRRFGLLPGGFRHIWLREELSFELLRGQLVKRLANVSRLIEAVGVRRLDVGAQHHLHRVRAAERGDREQHRDDPEIDAGEPAEPRILCSAVTLAYLLYLLCNFGRFHLPPPSSSRGRSRRDADIQAGRDQFT